MEQPGLGIGTPGPSLALLTTSSVASDKVPSLSGPPFLSLEKLKVSVLTSKILLCFLQREHQEAVQDCVLFIVITCVSLALPKNRALTNSPVDGTPQGGAEAVPQPGRKDLDRTGAAPEAKPSCLDFRKGIWRTLTNTTQAKNSRSPNLFWSDSNVSLSGATATRTLPRRTSPSEPLLTFCCYFPSEIMAWADLLSGGGGSRMGNSASLESGADFGIS